MIALSDNIVTCLLCGFGTSLILCVIIYFIAQAGQIQMSSWSAFFCVAFFCVSCYQISEFASTIDVKWDIYRACDYVESTYGCDLKSIDPSILTPAILAENDNLRYIIRDHAEDIDAEAYINAIHHVLNMHIWKRLGWLGASIVCLALPSLLFAKRQDSKSMRGQRRSSAQNGRRNGRYIRRT